MTNSSPKCHVCGAICPVYRVMCGPCFEVSTHIERFVMHAPGRAFVESALRKSHNRQLAVR